MLKREPAEIRAANVRKPPLDHLWKVTPLDTAAPTSGEGRGGGEGSGRGGRLVWPNQPTAPSLPVARQPLKVPPHDLPMISL